MSGIIIAPNPEFSTAYFEIDGYYGEIDDEGIVEIGVECDCGNIVAIALPADQLQELVFEAKKFRDRRAAFKAREQQAR